MPAVTQMVVKGCLGMGGINKCWEVVRVMNEDREHEEWAGYPHSSKIVLERV